MADLSGLHLVIVPAWWPSPEQPSAGIFFRDYALAFADSGARVGVVYPDLVSLRHVLGRSSGESASPSGSAKSPRAPLVPHVEQESLRDDIPVIRIRGLHTALGQPRLQMWRFRAWLRRGLEAYRSLHGNPEILHAMCSIPAGWACTALSDAISRRVVITEHFGPFAALMNRRAGEPFVREAITRSAAIVTVSEFNRDEMGRYGLGREIAVCGNPVAREFLEAQRPASAIPDTTYRPPRALRALFVGRLTEEKGVRELVHAAIEVGTTAPIEWRFLGSGPLGPHIRKSFEAAALSGRSPSAACVDALAASMPLTATCRLLGEVSRERVRDEMLNADFLVIPSHGETFGMAVAEALCVGLPVIVTRGTACERFVNETNGLHVAMRDVDGLRTAIDRMARTIDSYDRERIAEAARVRFAPQSVAAFYGTIFRRLVESPPSGHPSA
ncbi:MAG: glycosyltransferase [Phycisphaerae bacterium]|nr:glycosyltransferase [Phycisphaerae bacterium]